MRWVFELEIRMSREIEAFRSSGEFFHRGKLVLTVGKDQRPEPEDLRVLEGLQGLRDVMNRKVSIHSDIRKLEGLQRLKTSTFLTWNLHQNQVKLKG